MYSNTNKHQLSVALMLAVFSSLGPFTVDMYLSSFPQIMRYFGTNASLVQTSLTASLLGLSIGQIVIGTLSDVHGRRKPLFISMILYFLSSIGCAFAPNIQIFIAFRFIQGFVAAAGLVISRAIVRDLYSGVELTKFFALLTMITGVTPLLSPLAGSAVTSFTSWIGVFIFTGLLGIYLTIITSWKIKETLPEDKRIQSNFRELLNNYKKLILNRTFMGYALVSGIIFALVISLFIFNASNGIIAPISFTLAKESQGHIAGSVVRFLLCSPN